MTTAQILDFNTHPTYGSANGESSIDTLIDNLKALLKRGHLALDIPDLKAEQKKIARIYSDDEQKAVDDVHEYVNAQFQVAKARFIGELTEAIERGGDKSSRMEKEIANMDANLKKLNRFIGDPSQSEPPKHTNYKVAGIIILNIAVIASTVAMNASQFSLESIISQAAAESGE